MIPMSIDRKMSDDDNIYLNPTIIRGLIETLGHSKSPGISRELIKRLLDSSPDAVKGQVLDDLQELAREKPLNRAILEGTKWKCERCDSPSYDDYGKFIVCKICHWQFSVSE